MIILVMTLSIHCLLETVDSRSSTGLNKKELVTLSRTASLILNSHYDSNHANHVALQISAKDEYKIRLWK
jgi:hypothetical protein